MRRPLAGPERPEPDRRLALEVLRALRAGDVEQLLRVIGPHPRVVVDGCGHGDELRLQCAMLDCPVSRVVAAALRWELRSVNGGPGLVGSRSGRVVVVAVLVGAVGDATELWVVANPDKLRSWSSGSATERL
ncbi:hypothetical protein [uncultured Leifsonia sp.]|uniref:hypothetical protein n=1 Tax=uncultured Leifsonia sp. TaxID=340359 RepID=UPI0025EBECB0|nr:hypothetical protein [uncultured Leifsonia sp.]